MPYASPYRASRYLALILSTMLVTVSAGSADADVEQCRAAAAKVAASFVKKRAKHALRCLYSDDCDEAALTRKLGRLRERNLGRLASGCENVGADELGLGSSCPDPTGRCTQSLDSTGELIDCMLCLVTETLEPLIRRLHGTHADVAETCGGCAASECRPEFFCEPPPGSCEEKPEVGLCVEVPGACPEIFAPVCGCDGNTYENDCVRRRQRTGLLHPGPCRTHCGTADEQECPEGTFCEGLPGHCEAGDDGACMPVPELCPDVWRPVCGCDGQTYGNDCERRAAGVRLHHFGPCEATCGGDTGDPEACEQGSFCELPPGQCDESGPGGSCVVKPEICPLFVDPVCGCDGQTFSNDCARLAAGVSKRHDGPCESLCGGIAGLPCGEGQVCDLPPGLCNAADLFGHCVERPQTCPDIFDPVCGCDGHTYGNNCERLAAGLQLAHFGACLSNCDPTTPSCSSDEVCLPPPGVCDFTIAGGMCMPVPADCPMDGPPACGCDGQTYPTRCEMLQAGVAWAHDGDCPTGSQP